jgi:hypothetical protein
VISPGIGNFPPGAVPEPSTWAMMLMGFTGLGWLTHMRRGRITTYARVEAQPRLLS